MTGFLACTQWQQETQVTCPFSFLTRHGVQTSTPTQSRHGASFILSERKGGGPWRGRSSRKGLFNATQVLGSHVTKQMWTDTICPNYKIWTVVWEAMLSSKAGQSSTPRALKTALSWESWHTKWYQDQCNKPNWDECLRKWKIKYDLEYLNM